MLIKFEFTSNANYLLTWNKENQNQNKIKTTPSAPNTKNPTLYDSAADNMGKNTLSIITLQYFS